MTLLYSVTGYASDNLYGCSCDARHSGSQGTCGGGQNCAQANESISGLFCHANSAGGFPLKSCGEGCACKKDSDCGKLSFAGKCIENHCYSPVNGIFVNPLSCKQNNARN